MRCQYFGWECTVCCSEMKGVAVCCSVCHLRWQCCSCGCLSNESDIHVNGSWHTHESVIYESRLTYESVQQNREPTRLCDYVIKTVCLPRREIARQYGNCAHTMLQCIAVCCRNSVRAEGMVAERPRKKEKICLNCTSSKSRLHGPILLLLVLNSVQL